MSTAYCFRPLTQGYVRGGMASLVTIRISLHSNKSSPMQLARQLKQQRDKLKLYQRRIEQSLEKDKELARKLLRDGRKDRAKLLLRKKRFQEQQLEKTDTQLDNMERLVHDLEFSQVEMQVLDGLKSGNEALKKIHEVLSVDEVERILEETREGVDKQRHARSRLKQNRRVASPRPSLKCVLVESGWCRVGVGKREMSMLVSVNVKTPVSSRVQEIDELLSGALTEEDEEAVEVELDQLIQSTMTLPEVPREEPEGEESEKATPSRDKSEYNSPPYTRAYLARRRGLVKRLELTVVFVQVWLETGTHSCVCAGLVRDWDSLLCLCRSCSRLGLTVVFVQVLFETGTHCLVRDGQPLSCLSKSGSRLGLTLVFVQVWLETGSHCLVRDWQPLSCLSKSGLRLGLSLVFVQVWFESGVLRGWPWKLPESHCDAWSPHM
uniref:Charged multivesicular body protein 6 n=1 Tax=Timema douglasi TaxID=61478 RepID=A0A7R8VRR0_TIMDO|nr:unnamed protein product [Timema douglasi]